MPQRTWAPPRAAARCTWRRRRSARFPWHVVCLPLRMFFEPAMTRPREAPHRGDAKDDHRPERAFGGASRLLEGALEFPRAGSGGGSAGGSAFARVRLGLRLGSARLAWAGARRLGGAFAGGGAAAAMAAGRSAEARDRLLAAEDAHALRVGRAVGPLELDRVRARPRRRRGPTMRRRTDLLAVDRHVGARRGRDLDAPELGVRLREPVVRVGPLLVGDFLALGEELLEVLLRPRARARSSRSSTRGSAAPPGASSARTPAGTRRAPARTRPCRRTRRPL